MAALTGEAQAVVRAAMDDAIGRAIAAVLFDKAPKSVTPEEAAAALADPGPPADDRPREVRAALTHRAIRAGILAAVTKLTPEDLPPSLTHQIEDVMVALDNGETLGWATPAPGKRGEPGKRAFKTLWLAIEVAFQQAQPRMQPRPCPRRRHRPVARRKTSERRSIADPAMERLVRGAPKTLEAGRDDRPKRDRGS